MTGPVSFRALAARLRSSTITLDAYVTEFEPFLTRPLSLGPRPACGPVHPAAAPAATRTTSLERALIEGAC